ncbi:MAG: hypothetical protein E8A46_10830 [Bradyrhizobium sp.]|jgi:hypothetical protein|uniref:hypothetical protein n=1 Tax=Bradyrhizobium sp. TaxID=376 RepID=UPI00121DDCC0|nr:hypothetical protein [Bradyrhizobium sp.]THD53444.1 MAG: hypothetical protein E8A46_10830 [Bradyrhizobium sp.]
MDDLPVPPFSLVNPIETFILADVMIRRSLRLVLWQEIVEPALRPRGPTLGDPTMARRDQGCHPHPTNYTGKRVRCRQKAKPSISTDLSTKRVAGSLVAAWHAGNLN